MSANVERFLRWAGMASIARRIDAARALAHLYLHSPLLPGERDEVEEAMTVLLDDTCIDVRLALADGLARSEQAPQHIILSLVADKPPVAAIVAEHSPLILDRELVDLLSTGDERIQVAVARRPCVSRTVSAAVSDLGAPQACLELLANAGARMLRASLDRIVERHGGVPELRLALLEREDLPLDIRQILLGRLTASLRELVVSRDWMSPERADLVMREARERATIAAAFEAPADSMPVLVRRLMDAGELTPEFLIRAVASGQAALFESALAALARLPQPRVAALIASGRAASLTSLLQRAGLPSRTFPVFCAAVDVIRSDAGTELSSDFRRATCLIDAIVTRYDQRSDRELDDILALLRRFAAEAKRAAARESAQQVKEAA